MHVYAGMGQVMRTEFHGAASHILGLLTLFSSRPFVRSGFLARACRLASWLLEMHATNHVRFPSETSSHHFVQISELMAKTLY